MTTLDVYLVALLFAVLWTPFCVATIALLAAFADDWRGQP